MASIYEYPFTNRLNSLQAKLEPHFEILKATSVMELRLLAKETPLFCTLIVGAVRDEQDLREIGKICSALPRTPCVFHGKVSEPKLVFQLAEAGVKDFVEFGNIEHLLEKLQQLKAQATLRIDLSDFGVDVNRCCLWARKFIKFVVKDFNFLKYRRVDEIANQLGISPTTLYHNLNGDCWISPKQLLLCLQNYYAAYLLSFGNSEINSIAQRCGFADEQMFCKSFTNATDVTPQYFRREHDWPDFPLLYCAQYKSKIAKTNSHDEIHGRK